MTSFRSPHTRLEPVLIEAVVASRLGGLSFRKIAAAFNLALSTVFVVCKREGAR